MRLTTPSAYVNQYGVSETGRLLSNKGVISPAGDSRSDYIAEMYVGDDETDELEDAVKTELNRYIDDAQDEIVPRIRRFLVWPLEADGFEIGSGEVPSELGRIAREVTRYLLHDEDVNHHIEDVSVIERRYKNALRLADRIGDGTYRLDGVDERYTDDEPIYVI